MYVSSSNRSPLQGVTIARVNEAALEDVHALLDRATQWLASQGMNHWNGVHTKERIAADFEKSHVLVAKLNGLSVGTVTISFETPWYHQPSDKKFWEEPSVSAGYIRKLVVVPELMKNGIGTKLLIEAEKDARATGALYARLDTNPAFPTLVPYYQARGYLKKGERDGSSFFEKRLPPS